MTSEGTHSRDGEGRRGRICHIIVIGSARIRNCLKVHGQRRCHGHFHFHGTDGFSAMSIRGCVLEGLGPGNIHGGRVRDRPQIRRNGDRSARFPCVTAVMISCSSTSGSILRWKNAKLRPQRGYGLSCVFCVHVNLCMWLSVGDVLSCPSLPCPVLSCLSVRPSVRPSNCP